ncbi:MAG: penicillin-binding protein [Alphaproteobacteria bacterium]|nr:MAG: penicillin-binding protein [Alphaproteobacteria bacterium]
MAGRKPTKRVEPRFDRPARRRDDLRVQASDRVAGSGRRGRTGRPRRGAKAAGRNWRLLRRAAYWCTVLALWGAIGLAVVVGYYGAQLPQMSTWAVPERPPNARIVSVDGELLANRGVTGGEAMRLDEMSPYLPRAVVAIEDRRFKSHVGIDPIGLARAMVANLIAGDLVQGGSTLTQQLAKNLFLEPDRTVGRKIQEAVLALWLETRFSKDEILELYLNRVYFGAGAYGVDAAARRYFGKSASELTLAESALLAGLLKAPSRLSPARDPQAADARAQVVLAAMQEAGLISPGEAVQAMAMQPAAARSYWSGAQHYVADMVMRQLPELIGAYRHDVIVHTTIDLDLQREAEVAIRQTMDGEGKDRDAGQAALVALDPGGAIRALVGGREYAASQFNRAEARRQPGSAFKPIVFLAALEADRTPESVRRDAPVRIGKWTPENYEGRYHGPVTLREALAGSLNSVAAQLVMEVGPKRVIETARRLGIRSPIERNASIALGTSELTLIELTAAYAPLANGGRSVTPYLIRRVTSADGRILYERQAPAEPQVVGAREVAMMNDMLREVVRSGTGQAAAIPGWDVAGKTGTTQNSRDALFVGYTARLVAGVWFGNDDGAPMRRVTGGTLPARTWARFMGAALDGVPVAALPGDYQAPAIAMPVARPGLFGTTGALTADSNPRPEREVGARRGPRNILELIFGVRNDPG